MVITMLTVGLIFCTLFPRQVLRNGHQIRPCTPNSYLSFCMVQSVLSVLPIIFLDLACHLQWAQISAEYVHYVVWKRTIFVANIVESRIQSSSGQKFVETFEYWRNNLLIGTKVFNDIFYVLLAVPEVHVPLYKIKRNKILIQFNIIKTFPLFECRNVTEY